MKAQSPANDNNRFRIHPQAGFNFQELAIDNFAGGGGASTGVEQGLGRPVDIAINHDPEAISMHEINHPHTKHFCESVWDIDPRKVTGGRPVGLAWFSPDCKHFSKAKGGKPVSKKIRGLAWVALRWAATVAPRVIMLENVEEFVTWGPIDGDGKPCSKNKGRTFRSFCNALRRQGYEVDWKELRACDYGTPTIRKRLFLIARRDGMPIVWPEPTHGNPKSQDVIDGLKLPWRTAADIIDWSIPCPSIFLTNDEGKVLGVRRPLAENTLRRIAAGIMRYVVNSENPFFITEHANGSSQRNMPGNEPLRTICAQVKGGHFAVVAPVLVGAGGPAYSGKPKGVTDPLNTVPTQSHAALVGAFLAKHYTGVVGSDLEAPIGTVTSVDHHSLVTAHIQRDFGNSVGHSADEPVGTICAGGGGKAALVSSNLVKLRGTCKDGQPVTEPAATISAQGNHLAEVRAFLIKYFGSAADGQDLNDPLHTVTSKPRFGLVMVHGEPYQIVDIGMRMLEPHELYAAQGFPADYIHNFINPATGKPLSKAAQVRMCGNSVCPPLAAALVRANMAEPEAATIAA